MGIKIMLVDDHALIREGLKQILEFEESFEVIAEAGSGIECLEKLSEIKADILLLDINMPDMDGIDVLRKIKNNKIPIKVLILTMHDEVEYLIKAIDIGVDGYIMKDSESKELKSAINLIVSGESYIQASLIPALNKKLDNRNYDKDIIDSLTKREMDVLLQISNGYYNKEIAVVLKISERTVKNHITSLFKKIGVKDRTQAAIFAIKNNLVNIY